MRRPTPPELVEGVTRLYEAFAPATVYVAVCCRRVSLARTPQTRCATCPKVPTPQRIEGVAELRAWVEAHAEGLVADPPG